MKYYYNINGVNYYSTKDIYTAFNLPDRDSVYGRCSSPFYDTWLRIPITPKTKEELLADGFVPAVYTTINNKTYNDIGFVNRQGELYTGKNNEFYKSLHRTDEHGYTWYKSFDPKILVHRLMACTFLEMPHYSYVVDHLDKDKTNNQLSNLEWVTRSVNSSRGVRDNTHAIYEPRAVYCLCVSTNQEQYFESQIQASRSTGVATSVISKILNTTITMHTSKGYTFRYPESDYKPRALPINKRVADRGAMYQYHTPYGQFTSMQQVKEATEMTNTQLMKIFNSNDVGWQRIKNN